ncbi:hypothetical protein SEA_MASHLEY_81 [Microbacterium phage Mashley]|nr:hypothetical protein SEA_MASHLEY_81 [Microbacterium phage Mashley]
MHVLIDDQITVEVTFTPTHCEVVGGERDVVSFDDTHAILNTWEKLAPGRRGFRYARDESDSEPSTIIVAEASGRSLSMFDIDPHWTGSQTVNGYRWDDLESTLPLKVVD